LGWTVIAPDYSGFGFGSPTAWSFAEDEAHSVLDSTIAMKNLLNKGSLSGKVVVVGHSQGGHAALASHAYSKTYGLEGELVGVVAFAPLWINAGAWGAALSSLVGLNTTDNAGTIGYSIDYFYGHGEVVDGAGHGVDMFQKDKRDQVKQIFTTKCLKDAEAALPSLGSKPGDFYDGTFVLAVTTCELTGACLGSTASTWHERFRSDRPAIEAHGAPIVVWAGGKDTAVTPGRIKCAMDRMQADLDAASKATTEVKLCGDATAVHSGFIGDRPDLSDGITRRGMTWVDQWIAARTLGETEPSDCPGESAIAGDAGTLKCETPPSNKDY
jgi:pimeloyl-ACP methyl ester carboxylesterase